MKCNNTNASYFANWNKINKIAQEKNKKKDDGMAMNQVILSFQNVFISDQFPGKKMR